MAKTSLGFPTIVPASVFGTNAPSNKINVGQIDVEELQESMICQVLGNMISQG